MALRNPARRERVAARRERVAARRKRVAARRERVAARRKSSDRTSRRWLSRAVDGCRMTRDHRCMDITAKRVFVTVCAISLAVTAWPATGARTSPSGRHLLDDHKRLISALPTLTDAQLGRVARANGLTVRELRREAADTTTWLDRDGRLFF